MVAICQSLESRITISFNIGDLQGVRFVKWVLFYFGVFVLFSLGIFVLFVFQRGLLFLLVSPLVVWVVV